MEHMNYNKNINISPEKVILSILNNGKFEEDKMLIKEWNSFTNSELTEFKDQLLLSQISYNNKHLYTGLLNQQLKKEGIGKQIEDNGDIYIGQFKNDLKDGLGIYLYNNNNFEEIKTTKNKIEILLGNWKQNNKHTEGVYVWIEEDPNNNNFENAAFEAYVGEMNNNQFTNGIYLAKLNEVFYIYYGGFNDGMKNDDKCYFYDNDGTIDRVFRGRITNDKIHEGFFIKFHEDNIDDTAYIKFDNNNNPVEVSTKEMLGKDAVSTVNENSLKFRNILYLEDWFGWIYETAKNAYNIVKNSEFDRFDNENDYNNIVKNIFKYKDIYLYCKLREEI